MKYKPMTVSWAKTSNLSCSIFINNVGSSKENIEKMCHIIKKFASGSELFFGLYKKDKSFLSHEQILEYDLEISSFFKARGKYYSIEVPYKKRNGKTAYIQNELSAGCIANDDMIYKIMDKIFLCYLETTLFCPRIDWEMFVEIYKDYTMYGTKDYVLNDYADFLFSYIDSGDFHISFNPQVHDFKIVYSQICQIVGE